MIWKFKNPFLKRKEDKTEEQKKNKKTGSFYCMELSCFDIQGNLYYIVSHIIVITNMPSLGQPVQPKQQSLQSEIYF